MKTTERQLRGIKYLSIEPDDYSPGDDYPLIILLHGYPGDMEDLAWVAPGINEDGYIYICPQGQLSFEWEDGRILHSWVPTLGECTLDDIQMAEDLLCGFFSDVMERYQVDPGKTILAGISQGGRMTYRCGLLHPEFFAGLAAFATIMGNGEENGVIRNRLPEDRSIPIFIAHGLNDTNLAINEAREVKDFLEAEGYRPDFNEYPVGHEINAEVVKDLASWISHILPPAR
jgi:phospholipase/carboxylesterase